MKIIILIFFVVLFKVFCDVPCEPTGIFSCSDNQTCCLGPTGYRCYNIKKGVCCEDLITCCDKESKCDNESHTCVNSLSFLQ